MSRKLKKETLFLVFIFISLAFLLNAKLNSADSFDLWNRITGAGTGPQSLGVSVSTNAPPIIGNITTYNIASGLSVTEAANTSIFFSFVVTDADGLSNIVNNSAFANISRNGETTRYNDTRIDPNLGGCAANGNVGANGKNFTCNISIIFYDGAGLWNISVQINDTNGAFAQNTTTFTINELTALIIYPNSITFPIVGLTDVNVTSLSNITINNTGNDDISGREATGETINVSAFILFGATSGATTIPTNNFTIGTDIYSTTSLPTYCDRSRAQNTTRLVNTTVALSAINNVSGIMVNGSVLLAQAVGNTETLGVCFLDVPDDLTPQNYSTSGGGATAWTLSIF